MSPNTVALEHAWQAAQSSLRTFSRLLHYPPSASQRVIRVGQLDSEILDSDLANLLSEPLGKALALVNSNLKARFEPELSLVIQLVLYKLSVWNSGASYGAKLQDLRYVATRPFRGPPSPSGLPRRLLLVHGTLTLIVPYLHTRLRRHALSHAWPDAPSSDRRRRVWDVLTSLESTHTLLSLASFIAFLWDGRYRTTTDRALGMALVPSTRLVRRDVSYEFMNRQMVWHAFTEFLLFFLPLVNARTIRRLLNRFLSTVSTFDASSRLLNPRVLLGLTQAHEALHPRTQRRGKYWSLPLDQCAICAENVSMNLNLSEPANAFTSLTGSPLSSSGTAPDDISSSEPPAYPLYTPYVTSCGHFYCYHCITERMLRAADEVEEEGGWECLRCCEVVKFTERYVVDMGSDHATSDYEFSSDMDMDATDLSESVGSYSEFSQISAH
ncbi:hypothetical protein AX16_001023 [Volvariella volvacea WC 439]|nr:hypothetical protein AX16_001023 [Volvariella volvacea WC 439]